MDIGYVYVLYNPIYNYYGEVYKIGQTINLKERLKSYFTSYPEEPEIKYSIYCKNYKYIEKEIHSKLNEYRIRNNREYFKCPFDIIKNVFDSYISIPKEENKPIKEDEKFVNKQPLNIPKEQYIISSSKSGTYTCEFCKKVLAKKFNLDRHLKTCKKKESTSEFKCNSCLKNYSSKWYLKFHNCKAYRKSKKSRIDILQETVNELKQKVYESYKKRELQPSYSKYKSACKDKLVSYGLTEIDSSLERFNMVAEKIINISKLEPIKLINDIITEFYSDNDGNFMAYLSDKERIKFKFIDLEGEVVTHDISILIKYVERNNILKESLNKHAEIYLKNLKKEINDENVYAFKEKHMKKSLREYKHKFLSKDKKLSIVFIEDE